MGKKISKLNVTIRLVATMLAMCCQVTSVNADQWLYVDPLKPNEFISIETNPDWIGMYDVRDPVKYCKPDNEFMCIESDWFDFYLPRRELKLDDSWIVAELEFRVVSVTKLMLFGIEDIIYYIDASDSDGRFRYLYSTSRGLVGIGGFDDKKHTSAIFLLDVKCGYGAPPKCTEMK